MSLEHESGDPRQHGSAIGCITSDWPAVPLNPAAGCDQPQPRSRSGNGVIATPVRSPAAADRPLPQQHDGDHLPPEAECSATAVDFGPLPTLHRLVSRQVLRTPEALAVDSDNGMLTFGGLGRRAGRVARQLRRLGVRPGTIVGVGVERSPDMLVGMLGVLLAGGAYLPLDPAAATERLAFVIADANLSILLTHERHAGAWPTGVRTVLLERPDADDDGADDRTIGDACFPVDEGVTGDSTAYVIYTSGSTGRPKGVAIHHAAVANFMLAMQHRHPLHQADVVLQSTPHTFDISLYEIFAPLINGARLVLAPPVRHDPRQLALFMQDHGVTVAQFVPSMLGMLASDTAFARGAALRRVFCGGEPLTRDLVRRFRERSSAELVNGYGPTETAIYATTWTCDATADDRDPPIGRPLPNTRCHVLDERLRPLPIGAVGELFIGGPQVAAGYLARPELTAERFVADPFAASADGRLYRTGDLCCWRTDGALEFHGRIDHQVKIRGHRIEPGEIEAVLERHADVERAVVVARDDHRTADTIGKLLRGCLVPRAGRPLDIRAVRRHVAERLPEAMVPEEWLTLAALPLLSNGKVDRRALVDAPLADDRAGTAAGGSDHDPRTLLEHEIARIWMRLFQREHVGRADNFFDLGGHSLLAARLAAELERLVGQRIPIAALFRAPTVAALASMLADSSWMPAWASLAPLQPRGSRPPLFLTHGWGGDVYGFLDVARALAPSQPVYGLQAVGLDGAKPRHESVEAMAAHYVHEIRELMPKGPYQVGGHSLGGWIAYEIAQQLRSQGHAVRLLVFDTYPHGRVPWPASGFAALIHADANCRWAAGRVGHHLDQIARLAPRDLLPYVLRHAVPSAEAPPRRRPPDYYLRTVARYEPRPLDGHVHLFQANRPLVPLLPAFWRRLARRGLTVHRVPFAHNDMLLAQNAGHMAALLDRVLTATHEPGSGAARNPEPLRPAAV